MKARNTMKIWISLGALLFILILMVELSADGDEVVPTNEWINVYGENCLLNGAPLPAGAIIDAYDPQGVHCGRQIVTEDGKYGFMPVYRDYGGSSADEGAVPGDTISLFVNGRTPLLLGPDIPVWTQKGDAYQVNLSAAQVIAFNVKSPKGQYTSPGQNLLYLFKIVNTGSGMDLFDLIAASNHGWVTEIQTSNPTDYADPLDTIQVLVRLSVPGGIYTSIIDSLSLRVSSRMDKTVIVIGKTITTVIATSVEDDNGSILPDKFSLGQNYPNPFNPETVINYDLKTSGNVRLEIFNLLGQSAAVLVDKHQEAGEYSVVWNAAEVGQNLPSGVFFYRLTVNSETLTRKMILMK